jgi:hypothetical protein
MQPLKIGQNLGTDADELFGKYMRELRRILTSSIIKKYFALGHWQNLEKSVVIMRFLVGTYAEFGCTKTYIFPLGVLVG